MNATHTGSGLRPGRRVRSGWRQLAVALLVVPSFRAALAAQGSEWVTNGSFTGTLAPWTQGGGFSIGAGLRSGWDTTGRGISDAFAVNAGGQMLPGPFPPSWIEQTIFVTQGLTYEFRCDASGARPADPNTANADIGTLYIEVDSSVIARHDFGPYVPGEVKRAQLCAQWRPTSTGNVTLRIYCERQFVAAASSPTMAVDNVSVRDTIGPTFWFAGNRQLGSVAQQSVRGVPGALFATFAAFGTSTGMPFPGVAGLYTLDPATTVTLRFGLLDTLGRSDQPTVILQSPLLLSVPIHHQAGELTSSAASLGLDFAIVASQ